MTNDEIDIPTIISKRTAELKDKHTGELQAKTDELKQNRAELELRVAAIIKLMDSSKLENLLRELWKRLRYEDTNEEILFSIFKKIYPKVELDEEKLSCEATRGKLFIGNFDSSFLIFEPDGRIYIRIINRTDGNGYHGYFENFEHFFEATIDAIAQREVDGHSELIKLLKLSNFYR